MHCFVVKFNKKTYALQAQSALDLEEWIRDITEYQKVSLTSDDNFMKIKKALKNDKKGAE